MTACISRRHAPHCALSLTTTKRPLGDGSSSVFSTLRSLSLTNPTKTTSPTHEYDLCVSSFVKAFEIRSAAYRREGRSLPTKDRPDPAVFKNCLNSDARRDQLSDNEIDDIAERWRQFNLLQRLYLDTQLSEEFEAWRSAFVSDLSAKARANILKPGITTSSNAASIQEQSQRYGPDFKSRFYKSLCLNTIAVASLQLAKTCREVPGDVPELGVDNDVGTAVTDLWTRSRIFMNGSAEDLAICTKADTLEVFDFLYMFLLPKVVHKFEWKMDSRNGGNPDEWPLGYGYYDETDGILLRIKRYAFLDDCRRCFQPLDLIDLIQHSSWASPYPHKKDVYLNQRGMFDDGESGDIEWYSFFERADILDGLLSMGDEIYEPQNTDMPSWWDRVRLVVGSPFGEGCEGKYEAEVRRRIEQKDSK